MPKNRCYLCTRILSGLFDQLQELPAALPIRAAGPNFQVNPFWKNTLSFPAAFPFCVARTPLERRAAQGLERPQSGMARRAAAARDAFPLTVLESVSAERTDTKGSPEKRRTVLFRGSSPVLSPAADRHWCSCTGCVFSSCWGGNAPKTSEGCFFKRGRSPCPGAPVSLAPFSS